MAALARGEFSETESANQIVAVAYAVLEERLKQESDAADPAPEEARRKLVDLATGRLLAAQRARVEALSIQNAPEEKTPSQPVEFRVTIARPPSKTDGADK